MPKDPHREQEKHNKSAYHSDSGSDSDGHEHDEDGEHYHRLTGTIAGTRTPLDSKFYHHDKHHSNEKSHSHLITVVLNNPKDIKKNKGNPIRELLITEYGSTEHIKLPPDHRLAFLNDLKKYPVVKTNTPEDIDVRPISPPPSVTTQ